MHKRPVQELEAKEWPTSMKIRQEHCVPLYGTLFGSGFGINLLERS